MCLLYQREFFLKYHFHCNIMQGRRGPNYKESEVQNTVTLEW